MSLTDLQEKALAFYVAGPAEELNMVGRWWPRGELVMIIEDKVEQAMRPFGSKAKMTAKPVADALAERLIASGAFSTQAGKFGGSMHQFQPDAYKAELAKLRAENPNIPQAKDAGPDHWEKTFAAATA